MFLVEEPATKDNDGGFQIAKEAIDHLKELVKQCQSEGRFKGMDVEYFSFMLLSSFHGICALFCKDRTISFQNKSNEELMDYGYECFVTLLEKG
ncbi:hypothetical protein D3C72_2248630 [compost metagenome]